MISERLLFRAKRGNISARNQIITQSMPIIDNLAKYYGSCGKDVSTVRYAAILGFIQAIKDFDSKYGVKLTTYLYFRAKHSVQMAIRRDSLINCPQGQSCEIIPLEYFKKKMGWQDAMEAADYKTYFRELTIQPNISDQDIYIIINKSLNDLQNIEKDAILYMYGIDKTTLQKVGKKHGVSREYIRQIIPKSFNKFKRIVYKRIKNESKSPDALSYRKLSKGCRIH